ncbi:MAG: hypothetical protein AAB152_06265 [Candidatus Coatesbacteria bacterium]
MQPAKRLPDRPNLRQLKDQAADLRRDFAYGEPGAEERVKAVRPAGLAPATGPRDLKVAIALFVIAREYGFESWSALKRQVDTAANGPTGHQEDIMATPQEIETIKQSIRRAAAEDKTNPGYLAKCLLACEAAEAPGFTLEDYQRFQQEFDFDIKDMVPPPGSGRKVDWDKVWAGVQEYMELAARVAGDGWWSGFGAVKSLRVVEGLNAGGVLDALQTLDSYVVRLKPLTTEHAELVQAITAARGLVAVALGKVLEATGKLAMTKTSEGARTAKLQQEAGALMQEANDLVREIKERVAAIKKMGQPHELPLARA